jgi:hypothetical protein
MSGPKVVVGFDFSAMFQDLVRRGEADVAIVSTEEGFSPLGGSRNFFERELGISYDEEIRPLADWNRNVNEKVTLIAFPSRVSTSSLKGLILVPGENCKSYFAYSSPYGRKPHRDYYYNTMFESISQACRVWGGKMIAISHLSSCGKFHEDMLTCQVYVPGAGRPPQWLLCLATGALVAKSNGEPSPDSADQRVLRPEYGHLRQPPNLL